MRPRLLECSSDDTALLRVASAIAEIDCAPFFSDHIGQDQPGQKAVVARFQEQVRRVLAEALPEVAWELEHRPSNTSRDSLDIFGQGDGFVVAIELDKHRADQVAKKFVSRMAILPATSIHYVALCYPGTDRMNASECQKYFGYCANLATRMHNGFAGFIIR